MAKYTCYYYHTPRGDKPVEKFIDSLDPSAQAKFLSIREKYLEEFGSQLREPHSKYLGDKIYELRFSSKSGEIRILYFFNQNKKIILTNGYIKKKQRTWPTELEKAKKARNKYLQWKKKGSVK